MNYCNVLLYLDQFARPRFESRRRAIPPAKPEEGDCFIVGPAAADEWAGREGALAVRLGGAWEFANPAPGCRVWITDEGLGLTFDGFHWNADQLTEV